jgi:hypothetical protein
MFPFATWAKNQARRASIFDAPHTIDWQLDYNLTEFLSAI